MLLLLLSSSCGGPSLVASPGPGSPGKGSATATSSSSRSTTCRLPAGAAKIPFLLFRSDNRQAYHIVTAEKLVPPDGCRRGLEGSPRDAAAFKQQLDSRRCGGPAVASFSEWNVRFFLGMNSEPQVHGVMESPEAVHILIHQTIGGMPGGAQDELTYAIVFPPTQKPIVECRSVTDLGPYNGPMPP